MITIKSIPKHFNKSPKNSWSNSIHNMSIIPNFKLFGPREASQLNSWSQAKFKQAHTKHQNVHPLQAIIKQRPSMINEWNQSHRKLQDVYNTHAKFQVHPINHKDFTNQIKSCLTRSPHLAKQGRNHQTNRKCIQKFQENSHSSSTFISINMQKSSSIQVQ